MTYELGALPPLHPIETLSPAGQPSVLLPFYTGLALWSGIAKYFEYLFSETMWDRQKGKMQNFDVWGVLLILGGASWSCARH